MYYFSVWGKEDSQMDERKKALPIGIEFFRDFKKDYYYVDKTAFIAEFLRTKGAVNLFTRPRRFGKSLNMNSRNRAGAVWRIPVGIHQHP